MSDLFGDDSPAEEEVDGPQPAKAPVLAFQNGHGTAPPQNGVTSHEESEEEEDEEQAKNGEEELEEEEIRGPRDDISVSVTQYQRTADDFTFDVEVNSNSGWGW